MLHASCSLLLLFALSLSLLVSQKHVFATDPRGSAHAVEIEHGLSVGKRANLYGFALDFQVVARNVPVALPHGRQRQLEKIPKN